MKKIIKRKLLEDVVNTSREYWHSEICTDEEIREACDRCGAAAEALEEDCGINAWTIRNFVDSLLRYDGLKREATNEEIIELLEKLGWTVTDDE